MTSVFDEMLDVARRLGIVVRHVSLDGSGGGLAVVKGQRHLFIDTTAHPEDQLQTVAKALAGLPEIPNLFLRPDVRKVIERYRSPELQE